MKTIIDFMNDKEEVTRLAKELATLLETYPEQTRLDIWEASQHIADTLQNEGCPMGNVLIQAGLHYLAMSLMTSARLVREYQEKHNSSDSPTETLSVDQLNKLFSKA